MEKVVIGRPVNFQGAEGQAENQQALSMLVAAAREAGFEETAFLFEPMAAAFDFERSLNEEQRVLIWTPLVLWLFGPLEMLLPPVFPALGV